MLEKVVKHNPKYGIDAIVIKIPKKSKEFISPLLFNYIQYSDTTLKAINKIQNKNYQKIVNIDSNFSK